MHSFSYRDDVLHCEDVSLEDLANRIGTPAYVYSAETIRANVKAKWSGHEINNTVKFVPPPRPMYAIGG